MNNEMNYETRSMISRNNRIKQVRRYYLIMLLIVAVAIVAIAIIAASFSSQANDEDHMATYKYYKSIEIQKGDTLWSIANSYSDTNHYASTTEYIKEVRNINSLTSDNIIAGSYIIVPYYSYEFVD